MVHFGEESGQMLACEVSTGAGQLLANARKANVHSAFNNSFNLRIQDRLIHFGSVKDGVAPFGVGMKRYDVNKLIRFIHEKDRVIWDRTSQRFIFPRGLTVSLQQVEWTEPQLRKRQYNNDTLKRNLQYTADTMLLGNWQTGLAQTAEDQKEILHYLMETSAKGNHSVVNRMKELVLFVRDVHTHSPETVFDYWIGRGLGLTPSGDDVLTGMCAMLSVLGGLKLSFRTQLKAYLLEKGQRRTTPIALEYLRYAVEKQYHTHLQELCMAMINSQQNDDLAVAIEKMKKIGHTSGADTMVGVLLGIKAVNLE